MRCSELDRLPALGLRKTLLACCDTPRSAICTDGAIFDAAMQKMLLGLNAALHCFYTPSKAHSVCPTTPPMSLFIQQLSYKFNVVSTLLCNFHPKQSRSTLHALPRIGSKHVYVPDGLFTRVESFACLVSPSFD